MLENSALVILSGGQDSTTCLFWAKQQFEEVHALTIDYGQKHNVELICAKKVASLAGVASHKVIKVGKILEGTSPLVNPSYEVEQYKDAASLPGGLEKTFVPARNILFLTLAGNIAACLEITDIITGVCEEDFGGYPDCRRSFIDLMEASLSEGIYGEKSKVHIHTPLMQLTKKATVELAKTLPGCMEALAFTHTCYNGDIPPCGKCHACLLREKGFKEAKIKDPLLKALGACA